MGDLSSTQVWCHVSHGLQGKRRSGSQGPLPKRPAHVLCMDLSAR